MPLSRADSTDDVGKGKKMGPMEEAEDGRPGKTRGQWRETSHQHWSQFSTIFVFVFVIVFIFVFIFVFVFVCVFLYL